MSVSRSPAPATADSTCGAAVGSVAVDGLDVVLPAPFGTDVLDDEDGLPPAWSGMASRRSRAVIASPSLRKWPIATVMDRRRTAADRRDSAAR